MAITYTDNGGGAPNGSDLEFTYTFPVIQTEDVKVALNGVTQATTKYAVDTASNPTKITFNNTSVDSSVQESTGAPKSGVRVRVYRETTVGKSSGDDDPKAVFAAGSSIRATDLNANVEQALYAIHELQNRPIETEDIQNSAVTSDKIEDGTIVNADVNASAAIEGSKLQASSGSVAGSMSAANFTKLAGIETGATADQTAAEIRTLVESATDSNVFTDADHTKLNGIETAATADQTDAEIRTAVENATDSNVFTDADHTKLNGIETGATADQTAAEIRTLVESASDSNVFTDADHTKLNGIEASADVTDATNVNAAGAVMNSDLATKGTIIVGDGSGDPTILGVGTNNTVLIADSNEAAGVKWATVSSASGFNNVVEDTSPQLGGNLDVQTSEITTSTTNGNVKLTPNGTGAIEVKGAGGNDGTLQLNCSQNSHGVKIKSPPHSAAASYTLTLPTTDGNASEVLKTDGSGVLSWTSALPLTGGTLSGTLNAFGGIEFSTGDTIKFDTDSTNTNHISIKGPDSLGSTVTYTLPEDGSAGQFLKTDGSGVLSFSTVDTNLISDTSPQLGGSLDTNGNTITFGTGVGFNKKTGATNAVVNGITQHVKQNSLTIDGGSLDLFFTGGSSGSKYTFGSSDGATHEVMRITPSVLGASQHGKVNLNYVTANAGGSTSSANRLETTSTGMTFTGVIVPAADSTHDLGTDAVRWRNLYADTLYGDGSNLTGLDSTTAGGAIYENSNTISQTHTIPSGSNGMSAGPVSVSNGVTLTISSGSTYTVV